MELEPWKRKFQPNNTSNTRCTRPKKK
uniref:Uncharacterized protein n=1 Tax=Arundo donax TaxID=35708 RepID=A0A0A8YNI3_ARUDO